MIYKYEGEEREMVVSIYMFQGRIMFEITSLGYDIRLYIIGGIICSAGQGQDFFLDLESASILAMMVVGRKHIVVIIRRHLLILNFLGLILSF